MPIYAYRCATCGHAKDVLRKMSDPPLTECPACGASTFVKQVTAAGFQLKGSGWYVTDFKGGGAAPKADKAEGTDPAKAEGGTAGDSGSSAKTDTKSDARPDSTADSGSSKGQPAAAPAAPSATPATPITPATGSK